MRKKVFVLVSDGVSIRNFAFTSFNRLAKERDLELVFWNTTTFNLKELNLNEIKFDKPRVRTITDLLKTALIRIELNQFTKRDKDHVYHQYKFPLSQKTWKLKIRSLLVKGIISLFNSEKGIHFLRSKLRSLERQTDYYKSSKALLEKHKPDFILSASQRDLISLAPLEAASSLGIPTGTFIYSWDNIPKATTMIDADYYFVWSEHMKEELLHYQKYIKSNQIQVTGTPQFENHYKESLKESRETFFKTHHLNLNKKYICFSGDDITTSPKDEWYLRDVAAAVRYLNTKGHQLGIIFRRCPVDFSKRYQEVISEYQDVIVIIDPIWLNTGDLWNTVFPTKEDYKIQTNIIQHTECVVNLGSSMVFDYAAYNKPCAFINYNYFNKQETPEKEVHVYNFVHFRSKPSQKVVSWLDYPEEIADKIEQLLEHPEETVSAANKWYQKINMHPPELASKRILDSMEVIVTKENNK